MKADRINGITPEQKLYGSMDWNRYHCRRSRRIFCAETMD